MRLRNSRLPGFGKRRSYPTISLTWLLSAFFITCYTSQYLLTQSLPGADAKWLALTPAGIQEGHIWQFITSALVSPSAGQLVSSILLFFFIGNELEPILGPRRLAGALLLTQLPANAMSLAWSPADGQMGLWPGVCGWLAVLGTMLPLLEMRPRMFGRVLVLRLRLAACLIPIILAFSILAGWVTHASLLALPISLLLGYSYARWIGYGVPTRLERSWQERQLRIERWNRLPPRQLVEQEVNPILEKISTNGWQSITRQEKKVLRRSAKSLQNW